MIFDRNSIISETYDLVYNRALARQPSPVQKPITIESLINKRAGLSDQDK
jgi:hypothetical protein